MYTYISYLYYGHADYLPMPINRLSIPIYSYLWRQLIKMYHNDIAAMNYSLMANDLTIHLFALNTDAT